jgi:hypothetical protein
MILVKFYVGGPCLPTLHVLLYLQDSIKTYHSQIGNLEAEQTCQNHYTMRAFPNFFLIWLRESLWQN